MKLSDYYHATTTKNKWLRVTLDYYKDSKEYTVFLALVTLNSPYSETFSIFGDTQHIRITKVATRRSTKTDIEAETLWGAMEERAVKEFCTNHNIEVNFLYAPRTRYVPDETRPVNS